MSKIYLSRCMRSRKLHVLLAPYRPLVSLSGSGTTRLFLLSITDSFESVKTTNSVFQVGLILSWRDFPDFSRRLFVKTQKFSSVPEVEPFINLDLVSFVNLKTSFGPLFITGHDLFTVTRSFSFFMTNAKDTCSWDDPWSPVVTCTGTRVSRMSPSYSVLWYLVD